MPDKIEDAKVVDVSARYKFMRFLRNDVLDKFEPKQRVQVEGNHVYIDGAIVDDGTSEVVNGDEYDWFDCISPADFRQAVNAVEGDIKLFINSPGGSVFEAAKMLTSLEERIARGGNVDLIVDGVCASAATYLLVAEGLSSRQITKFSQIMIHNCWAGGVGNAVELRKMADLLEATDEDYARRMSAIMNASVEEVQEYMNGESWFTADQSVEIGLAQSLYVAQPPEGNATEEGMGEEDASENEDNGEVEVSIRLPSQMQRLLLGY